MLSTRKITVNVTQEHIVEGLKQSCVLCPIARALADTLKYRVAIDPGEPDYPFSVGPMQVTLFEDISVKEYKILASKVELPEFAREFIYEFDYSGRCMPISFELDVPVEFLTKVPA